MPLFLLKVRAAEGWDRGGEKSKCWCFCQSTDVCVSRKALALLYSLLVSTSQSHQVHPPAPFPYTIHPADPDFPLYRPPLWQLPVSGPYNLSPFLPNLLKHGTVCLHTVHRPPGKMLPAPGSTEREVYLHKCSTTLELGGDPVYFHPVLRSPIPTQAQGHATPFPPLPAGFLLEMLPP